MEGSPWSSPWRVVRGVVRRVVRGAGSVGSPRIGGQSFLLSLPHRTQDTQDGGCYKAHGPQHATGSF